MKKLEDKLNQLFAEGRELEMEIQNNLKGLGFVALESKWSGRSEKGGFDSAQPPIFPQPPKKSRCLSEVENTNQLPENSGCLSEVEGNTDAIQNNLKGLGYE